MKKNIHLLFISCLFILIQVPLSYAQNESSVTVPQEYQTLVDEALVRAGDNRSEMEKVLRNTPSEMQEGAAFLIAYMPQSDLQTLKSDLLLSNIQLAYQAREQFPWGSTLPDSIFLNEVLPYRVFSEDNEIWREDFYKRFSKFVVNSKSMKEAIQSINKNIRDEVQVDYNTKRDKADQNPSQSMSIGMASCTGLSSCWSMLCAL